MSPKDLRALFLLAAIWGGSFLFMRLAVNDFGPVAFVEMRIGISALFLLAVSALMGRLAALKTHWKPIAMCGVLNVALPFYCFAYAAQTVPAGTLAVINALVPMFGALIARFWLQERLTWPRLLGMVIGIAGIIVLVYEDLSFNAQGNGWAILIAVAAPFFYGLAACYTTKFLQGVDSIAIATGSVTASALLLLPLAIWTWPDTPISNVAWVSAIAVAVLCTGIAYIIFFRLIARVGSSKTITVTFLVPLFGIFWGAAVLSEALTFSVLLGAGIVLLGTLLATGVVGRRMT
ncbi:DMT family transporter [Alcaligenaceae bacterium]|nr:DMT family transporter [Alcaligenaceae bacterium]